MTGTQGTQVEGRTRPPRALRSVDPRVRKAGAGDAGRIVDVLVRAFDDDPVINWFVREDDARADGFRRFFDLALSELALPHDEVFTTADGSGAALWFPPGQGLLEPDEQERLLPAFEGVFGEQKLPRSLQGLGALTDAHPRAPHFYLMLLGVDPARQGHGVGSALLAEVLRRCDERGLPAYLEATNPRNVALYLRHGFAVTEQLALPGGGPPVWLMWRAPRAVTP